MVNTPKYQSENEDVTDDEEENNKTDRSDR